MAIKTKAQLQADITANGTLTAGEKTILSEMVESYEDIFANLTTVQRNAISSPSTGLIIYNIDTDRYEYWNGSAWFGIGQDLSTPLVVKVDLSSAELLALDTVPKSVAVAAGAGYALMPISIAYRYTYATAGYAGMFTNIFLKCTTKAAGSSTAFLAIPKTNLLAATSNRSGGLPTNTGTGIDAIVDNDGLELKADGTVTTGGGTLTVWVTYSIIVY